MTTKIGLNHESPQAKPGWTALVALLPTWLSFAWFVSKAQWFWNHQPDLQFGWIVLLLSAYVFWEAWETRPALTGRWRPVHIVLFLVGGGLLFIIQLYQAAFGTNAASMVALAVALVTVMAGNFGYVFGTAGIRHFAFSFCFILIALPMPSVVHNVVVGGLKSKLTSLNVEILNVFGIPAQRSGSLIRLSSCIVGIDEACSGIRSLQSTLMATLFIGYLTLTRSGSKIVLVLAGILLAAVGNLIRSLFLCYTAQSKGAEGLRQVHDTAGWSILVFTAGCVAVLAWLLSKLERSAKGVPTGHC